ncbi:MAG TPA: choice-of-anchor P family protein [Gaiellaceae bacterium]
MRLPLALALGGVLLLAGSAGASSQAGATASAFAVKVVVPGQAGAVSTAVSSPPVSVGFASGFAYPSDGSVVTTGPLTASASTDVGKGASSTATSQIASLSLFGGEVTAASVSGRARGSTAGDTATGSLNGANLTGLTVNGAPVTVTPNGRVTLGTWGYAITLEQAEVRAAVGRAQNYRGYVTALDVHLTADHGGLPAGSEILVGYAESWVQAGPPSPVLPVAPGKALRKPTKAPKPAKPKRKRLALPPPLGAVPIGLQPKLTAGGYVFPVYGPSSFTDTFGAFRGDVPGNWHHGDDIFAPLGAPILAVADGTVFSVGWNNIGGNRLWLRDGQGNEFYYAHLSAYSPLARNGVHVRAGDVIGFVGNTGDAQSTPYHLHFEVHPVAFLGLGYDGAVDPTPYLDAWKRLQDVRAVNVAGYLPVVSGTAPKPGAILLEASDISQANGLDPASLRRALEVPQPGGRIAAAPSLLPGGP